MSETTIINVGYRSTNFWIVSAGLSRILVDCGWPGTRGRMLANLRRMDVPVEEIGYCMATHYHIDHAGLAQEFKQLGVPLLVLDVQVSALSAMKKWTKSQDNFVEITSHDNHLISLAESRSVLEHIGIAGEILHTPGHSDDSVSLLLDDGSAFTGDLPLPELAGEQDAAIVSASWRRLRESGATTIFPAHGPLRPFAAIMNS